MLHHGGEMDNDGWTALIFIFFGNAQKADFGSADFKLLWEKEKDIN